VGYAAYDTVRYAETAKLDPARAPHDDRSLPDLHFAFYDGVVVFDHAQRLVHIIRIAEIPPGSDAGAAYDSSHDALERRAAELSSQSPHSVRSGRLVARRARGSPASNMSRPEYAAMLSRAKEYIRAGDIFQVVLGQRFERASRADPFDVYRALRAVNPSPYMVYLQAEGSILVASSPEILCRVRVVDDRPGGPIRRVLTNRPLAGTRRRGLNPEEDLAMERDLLADPKERAEHVMLVDLGRNDVGQVCVPGTITTPALMHVERYSHVMHISSTVLGTLRPGLDCWDALRSTLPAGTISGAPKIRAMQIIDELEPVRRGPYGGGIGYASLAGDMDIALALRTIVVPTSLRVGDSWTYHLQASGGIVADSDINAEFDETVNKAAALERAIDVAEDAFGASPVRD
jgi:anthranilate synthase component 1